MVPMDFVIDWSVMVILILLCLLVYSRCEFVILKCKMKNKGICSVVEENIL